MEWYKYENGKTIGNRGSENGIIIGDVESDYGARITLEEKTEIAPYAITFGIYDLMFHTHFVATENEARDYINVIKEKIGSINTHSEILEDQRDDAWINRYNELLSSLID